MMVTTILFTLFTIAFNLSHTFYSHCTGKMAKIQQMYPETDDYHCNCPAFILSCTFPGDALVASWYVFANGTQHNCNEYPNHMVDDTNLSSGVVVLQVNNTGQQGLEHNIYSCIALYLDEPPAESEIVTLPPFEGQL